MPTPLRLFLPILGITAASLLGGCNKNTETNPSIAGIAVANDDFSVLEDAAVRGGVVGILSNRNPDPASQGNYTVFAPNNAAFARLGLRSAPDLLALNKEFLTNTLFYHVTGGTLPGSALQAGSTSASALQGLTRRVITRGGSTYVNGSRILATDVRASNGTVHVIDKVLLATGANIVGSAVAVSQGQVFVQPDLTFLVEAVLYADLAATLSGPGPFTVFAPNDQAFRNLLTTERVTPGSPAGYVPADVRKLPKSTVEAVLLQHALPGAKFTPELPENATAGSAGGGNVTFGPFVDGTLTVRANGNNGQTANMVIPDIQCTNGVVHVIDRVLMP
ncbi:fasciclin domain-containing protein [Hymenobacter jeollabukensis]|uniref:Fasciclin domain-containing protein n=1 Tax=Hymenobacter jeollabukensis TaxID=2025313 RepID=A0A5R8WXP9_9BACT|nr:fasciclin domain-containing protein [Hymenobacter jeollabukensis]TLM96833.1 fasciclin domain-containing protein [Hymenobacter jeollabukensis]